MVCNELISETPATVANRLYNLILSFPSAATVGVEWNILVRTYNKLHSTQLDFAALGHSSPLVASVALLGDALRLVDKNETNPVVAIEDWVAMRVQPGAPATWPSLYKSLCEIVSEHGAKEVAGHGTSFVMRFSQLKPQLVRHGRGDFDETSWSYSTEQGKRVKVKKIKHLVQALVEWREECIAWRAEGRPDGCSELDQVLKPRLELLASKEYNDMLLRCLLPTSSTASDCMSSSPEIQAIEESESSIDCDVSTCASSSRSAELLEEIAMLHAIKESQSSIDCDVSTCASSSGSAELLDEIAILHAENAKLHSQNSALEQRTNQELQQKQTIEITAQSWAQAQDLTIDVWDNPFEPPPFEYCGSIEAMPLGSTALPSEVGFCSGNATPNTMASSCHSQTVPATPTTYTTWVWHGKDGQLCSMVPICYVSGDHGLHNVPSGVVQQALPAPGSHLPVCWLARWLP